MNQTYAHAFARLLVRPLLGTWVRPNHLTLLRIVLGIGACVSLGLGTFSSAIYSGILWFITCVLDRADGELARIGDMRSESGKVLDFYSDLLLDSLWFLGAGFALSRGSMGGIAIGLGLLTCLAMFACIVMSELFERLSGPGVKAFYGHRRFHPDDALFLLAVFPALGWLEPILIAASICTPVVSALVTVRYVEALRHRGRLTATPAAGAQAQQRSAPAPDQGAADGK